MTIEIFRARFDQKCSSARQRNRARLTKEQQLVYQVFLEELKQIVSHPHIQAHVKHWLSRFASRGGDISIEEIVRNIYRYMIEQRGKRILCLNTGKWISTEIAPDTPTSFGHFESLYREGRNQHFLTYVNILYFIAQTERKMGKVQKMEQIQCNDEAVFNVEVRGLFSPSVLLDAAARANYWEVIDSLVGLGGKLDRFDELVLRSSIEKTEWIQVYKDSYTNYVKKQLHKQESPGLEQRGKSSAGSSSFTSSYVSSSDYS